MKAEDNPFPYVTLVEQASAPATPAAGEAKVWRGTDGKNYVLDDAGTSTEFPAAGGGSSLGGIIAVNSYNPGTLANYSTSSTASADMDATNMAVTFTAPSSGKVLVRLTGVSVTNNSAGQHSWSLREGTTVVDSAFASDGTSLGLRTAEFLITGLTPGSSHTYKWAHYVSNASHSGTTYAGGATGATSNSVGPATMTVLSVA